MAWDDTKKEAVKAAYLEREPTPANSMDIVTELAEEFEESVNGVRMILTQAKIYIKKEPATKASSSASKSGGASGGSTRVSKEQSHASLTSAIEGLGLNADSEIISKLTGKAAVYFSGLFAGLSKDD